jgi:hypothetical protein
MEGKMISKYDGGNGCHCIKPCAGGCKCKAKKAASASENFLLSNPKTLEEYINSLKGKSLEELNALQEDPKNDMGIFADLTDSGLFEAASNKYNAIEEAKKRFCKEPA